MEPRFHWVSVADPLRAWREGQAQPETLAWRYRKTGWLWFLAASQRGRPLERARLAHWLWPHAAASQARANLRVLMADLQSVWKAAALPPVWTVQRDSLTLLADERLVTELDPTPPPGTAQAPAGWLRHLQSREAARWGETLPIDVDDELLGQLQRVRQRLAGGTPDPAAPAPAPTTVPAPLAPPAPGVQPGLHHLVLWRIEPAWDFDESEPGSLWSLPAELGGGRGDLRQRWFAVCTQLTARMAALGAVVTDSDAWGMTVVLGLGSVHVGQRWRALESMHEAHEYFRHQGLTVRMAAVEGRHAVQRNDADWNVAGWRLRLLEALALWAEPGMLACPASWADLLSGCTGLVVQAVQFRDLTQAVEVCTVPLDALDASLLPVGTGPAAPALVGREDMLAQLQSLVRACGPGQGPLEVRLRAPLGHGKTRVAAELARTVAECGGQLWWIAAQPELLPHAWRALHQTVLRHLPGPWRDTGLRRILASWGVALTEPQAHALQQFVAQGTVAQPEIDALASALALWWSASDAGAPATAALLVVDDLQWLDAASLQLLQRVLACGPALLCLALERADGHPPVAALVPTPARRVELQLPPLRDAHARQLLASLRRGQPQSAEEIEQRVALARGVPLFLLASPSAAGDGGVPGVAEHCEAWINQLQAHRPLLRLAARLGLHFAVRDLVMLREEGPALDALREATRLGLLLPRDAGHLAFFHPALRDHLLASCTVAQARDDSAECARHMAAQGDHARAADLWQQAGRTDQARAALLQALEQAVASKDLHATLARGQALRMLGYPEGPAGVRARTVHVRALLARHGPDDPLAQALADELIAAAAGVPGGADPWQAWDVAALAYLRDSARDHRVALRAAQALLAVAPSVPARMAAHWAMGNAHFWLGDTAQAAPWLAQAVALADGMDRGTRLRQSPFDPLIPCLAQHAWLLAWGGDAGAAAAAAQRAWALAQDPEASPQDAVLGDLFAAALPAGLPRPLAPGAHAERALARARSEGLALWEVLAQACVALHDAGTAAAPAPSALQAGLARVQERYPSLWPLAGWLGARALAAGGDRSAALLLLNGVLDRMRADGGSLLWADALWLHAELLDATGQPLRADASRQLAIGHARRKGWSGWLLHHGLPLV